jgi:guanine nucleotide-binding protein G(i) subunit alpha
LTTIASDDYLPTDDDIIHAQDFSPGNIRETRVTTEKITLSLYGMSSHSGERKKWIHSFENIPFIIYVVKLDLYDVPILEEPSHNLMWEEFMMFDSVINSRWFIRTTIILMLTNMSEFTTKLQQRPFSYFFPEYTGANEPGKASQYICERFARVCQVEVKKTYTTFIDSNHERTLRFLEDVIVRR